VALFQSPQLNAQVMPQYLLSQPNSQGAPPYTQQQNLQCAPQYTQPQNSQGAAPYPQPQNSQGTPLFLPPQPNTQFTPPYPHSRIPKAHLFSFIGSQTPKACRSTFIPSLTQSSKPWALSSLLIPS
jgi:hypothetical protein